MKGSITAAAATGFPVVRARSSLAVRLEIQLVFLYFSVSQHHFGIIKTAFLVLFQMNAGCCAQYNQEKTYYS